ncbi:MAG: cellulase family glycosylhydrolase [Phycisphaerae bacterium]|nr:cellulase family glycosylhydrolase [Phycisphaerae bacterium]
MKRRDFMLGTAAASGVGAARAAAGTGKREPSTRREAKDIDATSIPRWRGFNLQEMFGWGRKPTFFSEKDFEMMAGWGFNFVRLPMSYWNWAEAKDWLNINDRPLEYVDQAIELGKQYGIHVNLNFHRIPGYCVSGADLEPKRLFHGPKADREPALAAAVHHWKHFARRYKGVPNRHLSFDLMNEPPFSLGDENLTKLLRAQVPEFANFLIAEEDYVRVVRALVAGIREVDPDRLVFADGIDVGARPVFGIADLGLVQSARGYAPPTLTHYKASWSTQGAPWLTNKQTPTWPMTVKQSDFKYPLIGMVLGLGRWDRERFEKEMIEPWQRLEAGGVKVHVGEWGCYNQTPHDVALAWMRDVLSLWKAAGWGWALWEFRSTFGILDSQRADVKYEDYRGHKLDREMLELLKAF